MRAKVHCRKLLATAAVCAPLGLAAGVASAEVLDLPGEHVAGEQLERPATPTRGMNKSQVRQRFGAPKSKTPAVGEPPISRWVYDDYTVVFEHEYVLHAVVPEAPPPIYRINELKAVD